LYEVWAGRIRGLSSVDGLATYTRSKLIDTRRRDLRVLEPSIVRLHTYSREATAPSRLVRVYFSAYALLHPCEGRQTRHVALDRGGSRPPVITNHWEELS
jgi:hypothetical protein